MNPEPSYQHKIIIIDTNQARRDYLRSIIFGWGYLPFSFEKETICLDNLQPLNPDLVITGSLNLERTFRLISTLKMISHSLPVLIFSDDYAVQDFINVNGLADVLAIRVASEPCQIQDAMNRVQANRLSSKSYQEYPLIIGQHPDILKIKKIIPELSRSKEAVLIRGEAGTGKELVAKAIHCMSERRHHPFIKVNSTELQCELFDVKLPGYASETFSDLSDNKTGKFEVAGIGTLFLDEIEKTPVALQGHLLHFLEEGGISKFGDETDEKLDIRIIAAVRTDLDLLVEKGKFRKDLYYRLNILAMQIPPLRNRIEDIPRLTDYFVDKFCMESGRSYYEFSQKTKKLFCRHYWPENVKELKNVIKNSVFLDNEDAIVNNLLHSNRKHKFNDFFASCEDLVTLAELSDVKNYIKDLENFSLKHICREYITQIEKKLMKKALENTSWNRRKAAILLNISYKSLLNKIKTYNLT